jgi:hypothetical protein
MKHTFSFKYFVAVVVTFICLSSCINKNDNQKCCEGFTGTVTNEQAKQLVDRCHFLSKDSIEIWVKTYDEFKRSIGVRKDAATEAMAIKLDDVIANFLKNGSVSYNSCIVKKLLCNPKSIGLRVLYGIGGNGQIHIILVGIQPDYSNLYIADAKDCCGTKTAAAASTQKTEGAPENGDGPGGLGGAEWGQSP